MGTRVLVTNKKNGKSVVVRINDRGPYIKGRIIDVTKGVAEELGMVSSGIVPCEVVVLQKKPEEPPAATGETSGSKKELKS
jgi:rare lipoprotein A